MKKNMGFADRLLRALAAAVLVAVYFLGGITGTTAIVVLLVAAVLAATAAVRFCPLYLPLGIRTCKRN